MSFVINVTKGGERFFSTARGSCKTRVHAEAVYTVLAQALLGDDSDITLEIVELSTAAIGWSPLDLRTALMQDAIESGN